MAKTYDYSNLPTEERWIIDQTLKTGNLNYFTNFYFRLPNSGTMWMPDDSLGNYRNVFQYEQLHDAWASNGKPETYTITADGNTFNFRLIWAPGQTDPTFLFPHGYIMLDWLLPIVNLNTQVALAITGTGTGKTSGVAIAALAYCALYPGFGFLNAAPTRKQAELMLEEMTKWIVGTPFEKFIKPSTTKQLWVSQPYPKVKVASPMGTRYISEFTCQTTGEDASNVLGGNQDWTHMDECGLAKGMMGMIPKFATRSRAQRATGVPRTGKFSGTSNPQPNAELQIFWKKLERLKRENTISVYLARGINSSVNPFITRKQMAFQRAVMDEDSMARWHGGEDNIDTTNSLIPERLITENTDEALSARIETGEIEHFSEDDRLLRFEVPPERGQTYLVAGDPGQTNPVRANLNNVPVVTVWKITNFAKGPIELVYLNLIEGNGSYEPWLDVFRNCMLNYRARGYYDATNLNTAFEDAGAFNMRGLVARGDGGMADFDTTPITFAGLNKRWARTVFVMLAQDHMLRWPAIQDLLFQASVYKERGEGIGEQADDILAAFFAMTMALRIDGALWGEFIERYQMDYEPDIDQKYGKPGLLGGARGAHRHFRR